MPVVNAFDISDRALDLWDASLAPSAAAPAGISIFGEIGADGNDAKRIAAALRSIGDRDVVVDINSQGGNFFEGVAIYNLLREHPMKVTVRILGIAASAASVIAMAGDEVLIGKAGNLMIHNCSAIIIANRHELVDVIANMEKFDATMAGVYADRAGGDVAAIAAMMDAETYLTGDEAVEAGLADALLPADAISKVAANNSKSIKAVAAIDYALRREGRTRTESRALLSEAKGATLDAGLTVTHDAGEIAALATGLFKV